MNEIERMQENLKTLRMCLGWSAKELADRIGVSRQQIQLLESGKSRLRKLHYLAIFKVAMDEIEIRPDENVMAKVILSLYIDDPGFFSREEEEADIKELINMLAFACVKDSKLKKQSVEAFIRFMKEKDYYYLIE